ncbi:hypothetical protein EGR_10625 [Echinococcus granulosus]|uniref:Uncharacterized protein n=1 Tax=Echinococcus granulosus TaxID=6210 RepID=W6U092_ECHGR|nr:hypothetical protein EGR_10625 [Echinococcus granulosus]EUB54515.1 hypothetical protein EGR_10625 [Echinococcus granulosus]
MFACAPLRRSISSKAAPSHRCVDSMVQKLSTQVLVVWVGQITKTWIDNGEPMSEEQSVGRGKHRQHISACVEIQQTYTCQETSPLPHSIAPISTRQGVSTSTM